MSIRKKKAEAIIGGLMIDLAASGAFDALAIVKQANPRELTDENWASLATELAKIKDAVPSSLFSSSQEEPYIKAMELAIKTRRPNAFSRSVEQLKTVINGNAGSYNVQKLQTAQAALGSIDAIIGSSATAAPGGATPAASSRPGKSPTGWVTELQQALLAKAKELGITIDLGKTGVDGRYGNKTRAAVKEVAKKLEIKNDLDDSGRPSAEMRVALKLSIVPPKPSAPAAPAKPAPPDGKGAKLEIEGKDVLNQFTLSDGTVFLMVPFLRGFPRGGLTLEDEPWAAVQALRQMQYALESGGLTVEKKLPKSFQGISTIEEYDNYMDQVRATVLEIQTKCRLVANSFMAAVNSRRKQLGLQPASKPATKGSKEEVYGFELAYWDGALAGVSIATSAQAILSAKLLQFIRGTRRPLQLLLKESVDVNDLFKDQKRNEAAAKEIGSIIANTETELARQIDPGDSAYYFTFNKDGPEMKSRLQAVMKNPTTVSQIRQAMVSQSSP
jgi:hypothetical protein